MELGTGSQREMTAAILRSAAGNMGLSGRIGCVSSPWDMGGPLDAPEVLPAGAMNRTEWSNAKGTPLPHQSEAMRN